MVAHHGNCIHRAGHNAAEHRTRFAFAWSGPNLQLHGPNLQLHLHPRFFHPVFSVPCLRIAVTLPLTVPPFSIYQGASCEVDEPLMRKYLESAFAQVPASPRVARLPLQPFQWPQHAESPGFCAGFGQVRQDSRLAVSGVVLWRMERGSELMKTCVFTGAAPFC